MAAVAPDARASGAEQLRQAPRDHTAHLYERHARRIFRFCLSRLRSPEAAEDAVQTTFLNAQRALARGVVPAAESAWLLKIAQNVCRSHWSENGRRLRFEDSRDPWALEESVAAPRAHDELFGLEQALESLPTQQQRAILLREWQGLSYREIADELGLSQAAVETLIFRARRTLAATLRGDAKPERRGLARVLDPGAALTALKSALAGLSGVKAAALAGALVVGVVAGLVGVAGSPSERAKPVPSAPVPVRAEPPARPLPSTAVEPHGSSAAFEEKLGLQEHGADEEAVEALEPEDKAAPSDSVTDALDEATGDVVGTVEETADSLLSTATATTTELAETVDGAVDSVVEAPSTLDPDETELLDPGAVESALDDAVSTLP